MKKPILALLGAGLAAAAIAAFASPEQDRRQLVEHYRDKFPEIRFEDYVYGALSFDGGAKGQYDSIMELPPFDNVIDQGRQMWEKPFGNGKTFAGCFPNGGRNVAGNYPYFDDQLGKVVTFEMALNRCLKDNGEAELKYGDMSRMGVLTAYARTLSDGMKMNIKVESPAATAAYEAGKRFFYQRRGQLNFSCAICHVDNAGNRLRSELLSPAVGHATHWPVFRGGEILLTLQMRYRGCLSQVRAVPFEAGGEEFNNLEYFHSYLSNGLPLRASVFRK